MVLLRFPRQKGEPAKVCQMDSYTDNGFGAGVVIATSGAVVSLADGTVLRRLAFPQHEVTKPKNHLLMVARWGMPDLAEQLVREGEDVHQVDKGGMTPLHLAARMGRIEMIRKL